MASSKPKKVVSQDQLRRLMREKQYSVKAVGKRVEHPLAKYNSLNQLVCSVCNMVIKNENLWTAHIQSKQHKEKYLASKTQGPAKPEDLMVLKRKLAEADTTSTSSTKRTKVEINGNNSESSRGSSSNKMSALAGYSSSSEDEDEEEEKVGKLKQATPAPSSSSSETTGPGGLPADFFDASFKAEGGKAETVSKPTAMADVLPEGFFDDPKMDAKVRQVEYKDKMDEEWELFQRSMKEETHVSEAIIEEEDEQFNVERNLDEIDYQMQKWKEVDDLHVKKETIAKTVSDGGNKEDDSDAELEDEDLDQFLDWRSKKSWK